jgi:RNA polymerase sigma-70 factor (ECF subfamily)
MTPVPPSSLRALPEDLIMAACQRDPEAWRELIAQLNLKMTSAFQLPGPLLRRLDREDVLQVAFLQAWERIDSFEYRGEGSFIAWMRQIISNVLRDDIRHHACGIRDASREERRKLSAISRDRSDPEQQVALEEEQAQLSSAIEELPPLERRLINMRLYDGQSWREIAARTGQSPRTLRRTLDGVIRRLNGSVA